MSGQNIKPSYYCDTFLRSQEDRSRNFSRLCRGDVSVIGKVWICTLRAFLLGFQRPISEYQSPKIPKCEKEMRVSTVTVNCPVEDTQNKTLHNLVLPYVSKLRKTCQGRIDVSRKQLTNTCNEIKNDISASGEKVIEYFRGEENYRRRVQIVASGGMLGYLRPGGVPTRCFCAACGLAGTGMLCFPKETAERLTKICYSTVKAAMVGYYFMADRKPPDARKSPVPGHPMDNMDKKPSIPESPVPGYPMDNMGEKPSIPEYCGMEYRDKPFWFNDALGSKYYNLENHQPWEYFHPFN